MDWVQIKQLEARLPELEWQLSKMNATFPAFSLPKGLFRQKWDSDASCYASEIREDISLMATYSKQIENKAATHFLAVKINQKIQVLVSICKQYQKENTSSQSIGFEMAKISTRQEWLQNLDFDIQALHSQRTALLEVFSQKKLQNDAVSQLSLRRELGELEKKITLAEEAFGKATS